MMKRILWMLGHTVVALPLILASFQIDSLSAQVTAPANAYVVGNAWYCNSGFRRTGNECVALTVPANAYVVGNAWYCNSGFRRTGNDCVEQTPAEKRAADRLRASMMARVLSENLEGHEFSLRDFARRCEAYKYSNEYGELECRGSELRIVERMCEVYFYDLPNGEIECRGSEFRLLERRCSAILYSEQYAEISCRG